ncbi:NADPH-dependent F420 reductase [Hymenobacter sp. GOD-10R]|uniref:NADPH-dependent F420 reductase n=1 Tax=Hymenobacter sp. GOD-10R TaxID=3093922 RepID=UPI002D76A1F9|nr:NADPH-dependent F420 reductase [Hymenobacter sp. GOD-10R]WRQ26129.1 NADPH-dependent F420 reductase [Hymenobacter sp. GOD-10R]
MKIGTIGAGNIAQAFVRHAAKAGFEITISSKSGPAALAELAATIGPGVRAGTVEEAVQADLVLLSVPWDAVAEVLANVPAWRGQVVVDTTNAIHFPDFKPLDLGPKTSTELVAEQAPGARVVKGFNATGAAILALDPNEGGGKRVIFISGDDASAKAEVLQMLDAMGFAGIDLGSLAIGGRFQQFPGPLSGTNLAQFPA